MSGNFSEVAVLYEAVSKNPPFSQSSNGISARLSWWGEV